MHLPHRTLRHTTWLMLVVWLFALGAGVANACLLNTAAHASHASFHATASGAPIAHTHSQELPDPDTAGCLKFCDESTLAIKQEGQPTHDGDTCPWGMPNRAQVPAVASATAASLQALTRRPVHLAVPIAARPHRLTL